MRTTAYRSDPSQFLTAMAWIAIGSFMAGFGGYLAYGLNAAG